MRIFLLVLLTICLFTIGCETTPKYKNWKVLMSGTFDCPATQGNKAGKKGYKDSHPAFQQIIDHKVVNGVDVIIADYQNDERKPYDKMIVIADGEWHHATMLSNKKPIPYMLKATVSEKGELKWWSKIPANVDKDGKKWPASENQGRWWIDPTTGNKKSEANFLKGVVTCKRVQKNLRGSKREDFNLLIVTFDSF